ncbi:PPR domain-containing protein/PPR_2 domain-containing protein [Cephalotus follicularis]|uniref:PPR domain-containing protein/PPR_2 domain-containing protein n=1 Tax=Cephalotus follicularis TaxID=3775 RepID=A0A1Q3C9C0_CEPFO|nr:PPR domain-containing protein/PPR_2 domain-containing protein [Cephalotus follicularis]
MVLLYRIIPSLLYSSLQKTGHLCLCGPHSIAAEFIHAITEPNNNTIVNGICDSLRRGWNWETLSRKFDSVELNESLVKTVLLELKEPTDAKCALGFFHWSAQRKGFEHGLWSYSLAIHILVRARLFMDAKALLESILKKSVGDSSRFLVVDALVRSYKITDSNPFVFDLLVQAYAKLRMFEVGFDVCRFLEEREFSLSIISFNTLIHFVQKSDQHSLVWKIYEHMLQRRTYSNELTIRSIISVLCKEGKLQEVVDMLDRIHGKRCSPSVIVNTSLIFRIAEDGRIEESMALMKRMLQKNMIFDSIAYSLIVYAKVKLGNLDSAWEVYEEMLKRGFNANSFVHTSFIGAYCGQGRIEEANCLMQEMENMGLKPYNETYNFLIEGCANAGRVTESLDHCETMVKRALVPSRSAFNEMAEKLSELGDVKRADTLLTVLLEKGFIPDELTYSHLITGYGKTGEIQEALKLYYEMGYRSLSPGLLAYTSLIKSLCQCGKLDEAEKYVRVMKDRGLAPSEEIFRGIYPRG